MKQIYGIDLSQKKIDVNFIDGCNKEKSIVIKNSINGIADFLGGLPGNVILCAEHTGVYGDLLLFLSNAMDVPISFSTGYEIKHSLGLQKGKSDKVDAKRIREYGERFFDKLKLANYPSEAMKELKELFRLRNQLVKERKMLLTHKKAKDHLPFCSIKANAATSRILNCITESILELEFEIKKLIAFNKDLERNYKLVTSIKGVGCITTCELIVKTGNFAIIDTARKAASFAGVCPFPNSSGKLVQKSRISHMADKELKSLLYLCSFVAVNKNPEYKLYYLRKKKEGKPYFLIMNNVANKLLRTIYSIVNSGENYTLNYITRDPRESKKVA